MRKFVDWDIEDSSDTNVWNACVCLNQRNRTCVTWAHGDQLDQKKNKLLDQFNMSLTGQIIVFQCVSHSIIVRIIYLCNTRLL